VSDERPRTFPVILAGPSGAGKTTVRDRLLADPLGLPFRFSVSMTTREPREGEVHGVDYRFVDRPGFLELVDAGGMLEHAEVHGELYGTPRANLAEALAEDAFLLLDIDVQGARQLRESVPEAVSIFLVPPTGGRILERLRRRGSETDAQLRRRLESAVAELDAVREFDYAVVNDDLEAAVQAVRSIVTAESHAIRHPVGPAVALAERLKREIEEGML